jgi:hypothetical protein
MNYQRIHDAIIERAKTRKLEGYKERHHIIPRCIGGTNDLENLVNLTAKEHFIIHLLLAEIYNIPKLWRAVNMLANWGRATSRQYQHIKENLKHSEYTKEKMRKPKSASHRNNMKGPKPKSKQYIELTTGRVDYLNGLSQFFNVPASSIHWNTKLVRSMKSGLNFQEVGNTPNLNWELLQREFKKQYYKNKVSFGK